MSTPLFRRRLVVSPHVFQQICRYGSTPSLQARQKSPEKRSNLGQTRSQRSAQPGGTKSIANPASPFKKPAPHKDDSNVRWFEKDVETGEIQPVEQDPEKMEQEDILSRLQDMNLDMRKYKASIDSETFHNAVLELFPAEERKELGEALARERERQKSMRHSLEINTEPPPLLKPILRQFNRCLRELSERPEDTALRKEVWKWYFRAKRNIPNFSLQVPKAAWRMLWDTLSDKADINPERENRILDLAEGMEAARIPLTANQTEERLEAFILLGREEEAVKNWQREYDMTEGRERDNLEQGIKLFAAQGDIRNAVRILRIWLKRFPKADPRTMHPLIQACVQTTNDHMAYSIYLLLRDKLGTRMNMSDYDLVSARFLATNKADLALAVFRDMMQQGASKASSKSVINESERALMDQTLQRVEFLQHHSQRSKDVNRVSLQALMDLPVRWQNKFFFGSWIKKLIGMEDYDGAAKVVELMYQRGIKPDAIHVNGLVGGLFRSNSAKDIKKGEVIGWMMIRNRIQAVQQRGHLTIATKQFWKDFQHWTDDGDERKHAIPIDLSRPVPEATGETFNVIGLHYVLKEQWAHLRHLTKMWGPCGIQMTTFFMNQLLYMNLYSKRPDDVWTEFLQLTKTVAPDIETYNCLWQAALAVISAKARKPQAGNFPHSRALFRIMIAWRSTLNPKQAEAIVEDFNEEIYARIMSAFVVEKDFAACIVGMHAILGDFGTAPGDGIAGLVVTGLSEVYEHSTAQIRDGNSRRPLARNPKLRASVDAALSMIRDRREVEAQRSGLDLAELDDQGMATENINALSELVRTILVRIEETPEDVESAIAEAAKEMGVPGIVTGDTDATNVQ